MTAPTSQQRPWCYTPDPALPADLAAFRADRFNARLADHDTTVPGWSQAWGTMVDRLAALTGRRAEVVVPLEPEAVLTLHRIAEEGALCGPPGELVTMATSHCHANALLLAAEHGWDVGTGFAGSTGDAMIEWRRHSWCVVPGTGRIVETTEAHYHPTTRYFGIRADPLAALHLVP